MNDKTKTMLRLFYHALVTIALVVAAALLIYACVAIYRTGPNPGDAPFTREVVAAAFSAIAGPVWICVGIVAVGIVLHPLLPPAPAPKADMTATACRRLASVTDLTLCPTGLKAAVEKERRHRTIHKYVTLGLLAIGAILFLYYALDVSHFDKSAITPAMKAAMWVLLPCIGIPFAYGVFAAYHSRASHKREWALLKQAPAAARITAPTVTRNETNVVVVRCVLMVIAITLLAFGFATDGWMDVLTKAINICTECIGLG